VLSEENEAAATRCLVHPPDIDVATVSVTGSYINQDMANDIDEILRIFDMIGYTPSAPKPNNKPTMYVINLRGLLQLK
jgi:hypothetical protein